MIAIQPLANSLTGLQRATDRTAAELGLRRTNEELARIEARHPTASRALAEAQLALEQGRRRKNGLVVAVALGAPAVLFCIVGTGVPMVAFSAGEQTMSDALSGVMCVTTNLALLLGVLAAVFAVRALRLPRPTLSSGQAKQAIAVAQAEVSASAAELQTKQAEVEKLRRAASRDEG
jgi:hypothetical protein